MIPHKTADGYTMIFTFGMDKNATKLTAIITAKLSCMHLTGDTFFIKKLAMNVPAMQDTRTRINIIPVWVAVKSYSTRNVTATTVKEFAAIYQRIDIGVAV